MGEQARQDLRSLIMQSGMEGFGRLPADLQRHPFVAKLVGRDYPLQNRFLDTVMPALDFAADLVSAWTFYKDGDYGFLAIVSCGILGNMFVSVMVVIAEAGLVGDDSYDDDEVGPCARVLLPDLSKAEAEGDYKTLVLTIFRKTIVILNILTLGAAGPLLDAYVCRSLGMKTPYTALYKISEAHESFLSFMVNAFSLLISGLRPGSGWPPLQPRQALIKYFSIATSCVTLPMGVKDFVNYINFYINPGWHSEHTSGAQQACIVLYHATEVAASLCFLLMPLLFGPGEFVSALCTYVEVVVVFEIGRNWRVLADRKREDGWNNMMDLLCQMGLLFSASVLLSTMFHIIPVCQVDEDGGEDEQLFVRLYNKCQRDIAFIRPIALLVVVLAVVYKVMEEPELQEHLLSPTIVPLSALMCVGVVAFPIMTVQQFYAGRWPRS